VKALLKSIGKDIPVGARHPSHTKKCLAAFWRKLPYKSGPCDADGYGADIIYKTLQTYPEAIIISCGPLGNISDAFRKYTDLKCKLWLGQGGFAGDNCVPPSYRMQKFEGKTHCATYNFNGSKTGARFLLDCDRIAFRMLVSKNVCHSIVYDKTLHKAVGAKLRKQKSSKTSSLALIHMGMSIYLQRKSEKKFHDPLAVLCLFDPSICTFAKVKLEKVGNGWGSTLTPSSNTIISVTVDKQKFQATLLNMS